MCLRGTGHNASPLPHCFLSVQLLFCFPPGYSEDAKRIKDMILFLWVGVLRMLYSKTHEKRTLSLVKQMIVRAFS